MTLLLVPTFNAGLLVTPPPPIGELAKFTPLPLLGAKASAQYASALPSAGGGELPEAAALIFPDVASIGTLVAAEDAYITPEFDAAFLVVIPILFGGTLFGFYKLLKLFASAF